MTYLKDFWIAAATVAPVIALAAVLTITDNGSYTARFETSLVSGNFRWIVGRGVGLATILISGTNVLLQGFVLWRSLYALVDNSGDVSVEFVISCEVLGLIAVAAAALLNVQLGYVISRAKPNQLRKPEDSLRRQSGDLNLDRVREIITELEAQASSLELPSEDAAQLRAEIATIKAQVNSPRPNHQAIREHLLSVKAILENTSGGRLLELLQHIQL